MFGFVDDSPLLPERIGVEEARFMTVAFLPFRPYFVRASALAGD
jgi:hypothetical protein